MIAGVFALIVVPLLAAGVAFVLRRFQTVTALLATGVAAALGAGALWLPLDRVIQLGGRQVALGESVELLGRHFFRWGWRSWGCSRRHWLSDLFCTPHLFLRLWLY